MTEVLYKLTIDKNDGTPIVLGNVSGTLLHIDDINITKDSRLGSAEIIIDNLNNRYDGEFDDFNEFELEMSFDGGSNYFTRFAGEVRENTPDENNFTKTLLCKDWNYWLSERAWTGSRTNTDMGQIIYDMLDEKFPEFDLSQINTSTGIIFDRFISDSKYINENLDILFRENEWNLIVDFDKVVRLFETNRGDSGIILNSGDSGNVTKDSINLKDSNLTNKNSVTVIGGKELIEDEVDTFTYIGGSQFFTLYNKALNISLVTVNATPTSNWNLSSNGINLEVTDSLSVSDVIVVTYDHEIPVWYKESDIGATKLREFIVKDPNIITITRAENYAKALLQKLNTKITKGTLSSAEISVDFGWFQTLTLGDVNGFTGTHIITSYTERIGKIHSVIFSISQVLDENTRIIFNLIREIESLKSTDDTDITVIDGFIVLEIFNLLEEITCFQKGKGTRWIINDSTNGPINDIYTLNAGETTEIEIPL